MKQVCLLCERTSPDNNLYCQETYCPAEMSPNILGYGEWIGDIEIIKPVIVLRSAVLYEATHQKKKVFLKVAHPGTENKERLKREAEFLRDIQLRRSQSRYLPTLLPPYANTTLKVDAYGKTMLQGHLLYFYLFEYVEGQPLRDIITENPQLWINHVCWIVIGLAYAIAFLHSKGLYHFGLSPEGVLVRFDEKPNVPRVLLFDLGLVSDAAGLKTNWYPFCVLPAYTAPELVSNGKIRPEYATDVYGLGLILYELLVGEPAFTFKLQSDHEVYRTVQRNRLARMTRVEDVKTVADIAIQAVDPQVTNRQQDATVLAKQLLGYFGELPGEKKSRWPNVKTILIVVAALLAIAFLLAVVISLNNFGPAL
jgi:serine/threonine protein kinase